MANFAKGFVQGFSPNISNASDLISRILIKQYDNSMDLKAQDQKRKYDEQQQKLIDTQDQAYYDSYISDPLKYGAYLGKMSPGMRAAANEWVSKQPHYKEVMRTDEQGTHRIRQKIDWQDNVLEENVVDTIPTVSSTEQYTKDGVTTSYDLMSDGKRKLKSKKVDLDQKKKEAESFIKFRTDVLTAIKSKGKSKIYADNGDDINSQLNDLDYNNRKTALRFQARKEANQTVNDVIDDIDNTNSPENYAEAYKNTIMQLRKSGSSEKEVSYIASWYLLKTGKELE